VQAADILVGGAIDAGHACNAISIGMRFFDATPFTGSLPAVPPDPCACGLVSDGGVGCWVAEAGAAMLVSSDRSLTGTGVRSGGKLVRFIGSLHAGCSTCRNARPSCRPRVLVA
jgi:hypothetical protein